MKRLDQILEVIDVGLQRSAPTYALHYNSKPRCWRCLHNEPRLPDNPESLCEGCFAYCSMESDHDPTRPGGRT